MFQPLGDEHSVSRTDPTFINRTTFLTQIEDRRIRRFADHWLALRGKRALPLERDLNPVDFPYALSIVLLTDLRGEMPIYRLAGDEVETRVGQSLRGKSPYDVLETSIADAIVRNFATMRSERAAWYGLSELTASGGQERAAERVGFPLTNDSGEVSAVVSFVAWRGIAAGMWPEAVLADPKHSMFWRVDEA